jgi:putative endonuclease
MHCYCYILYTSKLNKYYIGCTNDLERRLEKHNRGKEKFTTTGLPWRLVHKELFEDLKQARQRELSIKKMNSRKYIETLISSAEYSVSEEFKINFTDKKYKLIADRLVLK